MDRLFAMVARQVAMRLIKRVAAKGSPQFNKKRVADTVRLTRRIGRL